MSISLDGFVAGPHQGRDAPLGGLRLHEWHWHAGEPGHEADAGPRDELMKRRGAFVMGRNMFGPIRGAWDGDWRGWWGDEPPYHAPVFVLTHHAHEPIVWTTTSIRPSLLVDQSNFLGYSGIFSVQQRGA